MSITQQLIIVRHRRGLKLERLELRHKLNGEIFGLENRRAGQQTAQQSGFTATRSLEDMSVTRSDFQRRVNTREKKRLWKDLAIAPQPICSNHLNRARSVRRGAAERWAQRFFRPKPPKPT